MLDTLVLSGPIVGNGNVPSPLSVCSSTDDGLDAVWAQDLEISAVDLAQPPVGALLRPAEQELAS